MVLERNLERRFRLEIKKRNGWAIKWTGIAGLPDRLVFMPGGRLYLVELKTERGRTSKIQRAVHRKFAALGFAVEVLHGWDEIKEWLEQL